jgi:hypothetical protein
MTQSDSPKTRLSYDDSIEYLGLNHRNLNSLLRADVNTIRDLVKLIQEDKLRSIYRVGDKSAEKIRELVQRFKFVGAVNVGENSTAIKGGTTTKNGVTTQIKCVPTISNEVVTWQLSSVEKLIQSGLLHKESKILGKSISYWMSQTNLLDPRDSFDLLRVIISSSVSMKSFLIYLINCRINISRYYC